MSAGEDLFEFQCNALGLFPAKEYRFAQPRMWRFDFCWPAKMVAVEIEGGVWSQGRHTRGTGFVGDCEKLNHAAELGYRVFRFPTHEVKNGHAVATIERVLRG